MPVTLILLVSQCFWCWRVDCLQSINSDKLSKFVNAINGNEGTGYEPLHCCSLHFTDCYIPGAFVLLFFRCGSTFHPSLSPVISLSLGTLHEWMRMQMLAKPSSNLLQRTGVDHRGGHAQLEQRTFMMTCLRWILGYMRLEIWCKIGLSGDRCLCTALHTCSAAIALDWIGLDRVSWLCLRGHLVSVLYVQILPHDSV